MALIDVIRNGVKVASKITESVKAPVIHRAWIGQDGFGKSTYAAPVTLRAIVDRTRRQKYTATGKVAFVIATLTFVDPIPANGTVVTPAQGGPRQEPIDPRDIIILSDGTTGPIVQEGGIEDAATTRPFVNQILLGEVNQR